MAPPSSTNKPKRKKNIVAQASNELVLSDSKTGAESPAFPLVAFLWPAKKNASQWVILPLVLMIVGLFRWCTGFWGYSGRDDGARSEYSADLKQDSRLPQCVVTTKLKGIGWKLPPTCPYPNGTSMISSTGAWTIRL